MQRSDIMSEDTQTPKEILGQAVEIPDLIERKVFLDDVCAGDEALWSEVESPLAAYAKSEDFLDVPAMDPAVTLEMATPV
jgi:hypothetical protein